MITMHKSVEMRNAEARNVLAHKVIFITPTSARKVVIDTQWVLPASTIEATTFGFLNSDFVLRGTKRAHSVEITLDVNSQL